MANSSMLGISFPKIENKLHKLDDVKILQSLKNGIYGIVGQKSMQTTEIWKQIEDGT